MELITHESEIVKDFFIKIGNIHNVIEKIIKNNKPLFEDDRYLTGEEVCEKLRLSKRTLKEYRDSGKLSYISLPGKILYKETDIHQFLEKNRCEAWK